MTTPTRNHRENIIALLDKTGKVMTVADMAKAIGIDTQRIASAASSLKAKGTLVTLDDSLPFHYQLADGVTLASYQESTRNARATSARVMRSQRDAVVAAEDDEQEVVDFALWESGVLQVQVGEEHFSIPPGRVDALREYLNRQASAKRGAFSLGGGGGVLGALGPLLSGFVAQPEPPNKFASWLTQAAREPAAAQVNAAPPAPPAPPAPAPTDAVGLPGVEQDGPAGIGGDALISHGMTRSEQFAEAAARG